jgi:hypothetical protein
VKKLLAAAFSFLLSVMPAAALTRAGAPAKFSIPFANGATGGFINYPIPTPSQIPFTNCLASLTDGFPPKSMQSVASGGCAPFGQDFNGILKQITQWNQQSQAGAAPIFDASFSTSIGGYPEGSILSQSSNPSCLWVSQADNNTNNPDTGGANWTGVCPGGGAGGTSTGSANAQVIAATPFVIQSGAQVCWTAGFTNTGALQINVNGAGLTNVLQRTQGGLTALVGGEVHVSSIHCATNDGTQWQLNTFATIASLVNQDQTLKGGANVTPADLGTVTTGTVTIDCGKSPLQKLTDGGTFTIAAPANDGSCMILITNTGGAVAPSFSGFTSEANHGDPFDTTNGHKFTVTIWEINGTASYLNHAMQ